MNPVAVYAFSTIFYLLPMENSEIIGFGTVINISAGTALFHVPDAVDEILPRTRASLREPKNRRDDAPARPDAALASRPSRL